MKKPSKNNLPPHFIHPDSPQARKLAAGDFMIEARRSLAVTAFRLLPEAADVARKISQDPKARETDRVAAARLYESIKRVLQE